MKSILISIKPEYVEKILNGEKTIEIRKRIPKCDLPCKVYIYCTKQGRPLVYGSPCPYYIEDSYVQTYNWSKEDADRIFGNLQGKVVAEFTLNVVKEFEWLVNYTNCCLSMEEVLDYCKGQDLYAWYIDNLKIYDEPKKLNEFSRYGYEKLNGSDKDCILTRPPSSWCYVEDIKDIGEEV